MRILPGPTKSNQTLAWSPDGRHIVAGGTGDGIMVWEVDGTEPGRRILNTGHSGNVMRFCPRTGRLLVAFRTGGVWHWEPDTDAEVRYHLSGEALSLFHASLSADGAALVGYAYRAGRHALHRFDVGDRQLHEAWSQTDSKWPVTQGFVLRGDDLFGVPRHGRGFEWGPPAACEPTGWMDLGYDPSPWALSPDGERVAHAGRDAFCVTRLDGTGTLSRPLAADARVRAPAWSPDGRVVAFALRSTLYLLDADTLTELRALDWNAGHVRAIIFSPDGLRAAVSTGGGKGWVTVLDLE